MKQINLPDLVELAWKMTTDHHNDYEPGELICPGTHAELADIIANPVTILPPPTINGLNVYRITLDPSQTRDQSEREIRYSMIYDEASRKTVYFLHD